MWQLLITSAVTAVLNSGLPGEVWVNYLPLGSNGAYVVMTPGMLGEKPELILKDKKKISKLFKLLTKNKTDKKISPQFITFVFRYGESVIYVDCDGVVQSLNQNYLVDPKSLEMCISHMGVPSKSGKEPIPSEWQ